MKMSLRQYCIEHGRDTLLREWDAARNGGLTRPTFPSEVIKRYGGSAPRVTVGRRRSTPVRRAVAVRTVPDAKKCLKTRWRCKSPRLKPSGTRRKRSAEICRSDRRQPQKGLVAVSCRAFLLLRGQEPRAGHGCPVCAGRVVLPDENSLAARYPALVAEWDTEKNAPLLPTLVAPGTVRKAWWRCPKGHSYRAAISSPRGWWNRAAHSAQGKRSYRAKTTSLPNTRSLPRNGTLRKTAL